MQENIGTPLLDRLTAHFDLDDDLVDALIAAALDPQAHDRDRELLSTVPSGDEDHTATRSDADAATSEEETDDGEGRGGIVDILLTQLFDLGRKFYRSIKNTIEHRALAHDRAMDAFNTAHRVRLARDEPDAPKAPCIDPTLSPADLDIALVHALGRGAHFILDLTSPFVAKNFTELMFNDIYRDADRTEKIDASELETVAFNVAFYLQVKQRYENDIEVLVGSHRDRYRESIQRGVTEAQVHLQGIATPLSADAMDRVRVTLRSKLAGLREAAAYQYDNLAPFYQRILFSPEAVNEAVEDPESLTDSFMARDLDELEADYIANVSAELLAHAATIIYIGLCIGFDSKNATEKAPSTK